MPCSVSCPAAPLPQSLGVAGSSSMIHLLSTRRDVRRRRHRRCAWLLPVRDAAVLSAADGAVFGGTTREEPAQRLPRTAVAHVGQRETARHRAQLRSKRRTGGYGYEYAWRAGSVGAGPGGQPERRRPGATTGGRAPPGARPRAARRPRIGPLQGVPAEARRFGSSSRADPGGPARRGSVVVGRAGLWRRGFRRHPELVRASRPST